MRRFAITEITGSVDPDRMAAFIANINSSSGYFIEDTWNDVTSNIEDGSNMLVSRCPILTNFSASLESLVIGNDMFRNNSALISFYSNLSNLKYGRQMFTGCSSIVNFNVAMPLLENGESMFLGCTSLENFTGSMTSLTNGTQMFNSCDNLTVDSLVQILTDLPDRTATSTATIGIGSVNTAKLTPQQIAIAVSKNWNVV